MTSIYQIGIYTALMGVFTYIAYIILSHLDKIKNIKIKKEIILENTEYLERKILEKVDVNKSTVIKKYSKMMKESGLSKHSINITFLVIVASIIAVFVYGEMHIIFNQSLAALIVSLVAFTIPFQFLELEVSYRRYKMRKHLPHFLLMLQQMYDATGSSISALKAIKDEIKQPIRDYINEYLKDISKGMENNEAIEKLKEKSDNSVFMGFCEDIYAETEYGKIIRSEIKNQITKAYMHEENYMERVTSNSGSMTSVIIVLIVFVVGVRRIISMDNGMVDILRNTNEGRFAVSVVLVLLIIVGVVLKASVSYKDSQ